MIKEAWLGLHEVPTTSIRCVVRSDVDGTLTAVVNGVSYAGETLEVSGTEFMGKVDITGLTANSTYSVGLAIDGVVLDTLTGLTAIDSRGDNWSFIATSCWSHVGSWSHGNHYKDDGLQFFMALGDQVYIDDPAVGLDIAWPGTETHVLGSDTITLKSMSWMSSSDDLNREPTDTEYLVAYNDSMRVAFSNKGFKQMIRGTPFIQTTDDHTWPGNGGSRNAGAQGNNGLNAHRGTGNAKGPFCADQAAVDKQWQFGIDVYRQWAKGNPDSSDVDSRATFSAPLENAERLYYDFVIGSVHVIVLETSAFRDVAQAGMADEIDSPNLDGKANEDATKRMLDQSDIWSAGTEQPQMDWLESTLKNSNSTFKCIISSRETIGISDGWAMYDTDLARFLAYLLDGSGTAGTSNTAGWKVPGGVFAISGDTHRAAVMYDDTNKHLQVRACPASTTVNSTEKPDTAVYFDVAQDQYVSCKVDVHGEEYVDVQLIGTGAQKLWSRRIYAGSSEAIVYEAPVSI